MRYWNSVCECWPLDYCELLVCVCMEVLNTTLFRFFYFCFYFYYYLFFLMLLYWWLLHLLLTLSNNYWWTIIYLQSIFACSYVIVLEIFGVWWIIFGCIFSIWIIFGLRVYFRVAEYSNKLFAFLRKRTKAYAVVSLCPNRSTTFVRWVVGKKKHYINML